MEKLAPRYYFNIVSERGNKDTFDRVDTVAEDKRRGQSKNANSEDLES